ncbi:MAG TPA: hypothetical protein VD867_07430, partial [Burkholderiales bacterium]|nr:hypothetical protein [Burkholderiales bacterium]
MRRKHVVRWVAAGLGLASAALALSFAIAPYPVAGFTSAREAWRASDAWLLDRNGVALSRVRVDHDRRRGEWVPLGEVSPVLTGLVIAAEDRRFREH